MCVDVWVDPLALTRLPDPALATATKVPPPKATDVQVMVLLAATRAVHVAPLSEEVMT